MITYVLSQHSTYWHVHRYGDDVTRTASGIDSEEDALAVAVRKAKEDAPSQILRITLSGDSRIIAQFDRE